MIIPVVITVYADRSFHLYYQDAACGCFDYRRPPRSKKGSGEPNRNKVGSLTHAQVEIEIAKLKLL